MAQLAGESPLECLFVSGGLRSKTTILIKAHQLAITSAKRSLGMGQAGDSSWRRIAEIAE